MDVRLLLLGITIAAAVTSVIIIVARARKKARLSENKDQVIMKYSNEEEAIASGENGSMFKYKFTITDTSSKAKFKALFHSSCRIRNYLTILRDKDDIAECPDCKGKLKSKTVAFSICTIEMGGGFGRTMQRPVLYCPKCDKGPSEFETLRLPMQMAISLS